MKDLVICLAGGFFQQLQQEPGSFFSLLIGELLHGCEGSVVHVMTDRFVGKADDTDVVCRSLCVLDGVEGYIIIEGDDGVGLLFYGQELLHGFDGAVLGKVG